MNKRQCRAGGGYCGDARAVAGAGDLLWCAADGQTLRGKRRKIKQAGIWPGFVAPAKRGCLVERGYGAIASLDEPCRHHIGTARRIRGVGEYGEHSLCGVPEVAPQWRAAVVLSAVSPGSLSFDRRQEDTAEFPGGCLRLLAGLDAGALDRKSVV